MSETAAGTTTDATTDAATTATTDAPGSTTTEPKVHTFTQEKLDAIIGSRIAEERAKFADYDELKAAKVKLDEVEAANLTEAEKVQRERDEAKAEAAKTAEDAAKTAAENLRLRVAMDTKLPAELIDRLRGDTEEALREDAANLLKLVKPSGSSFDGGVRQTAEGKLTRDEAIAVAKSDPNKFNALVDEGKIDTSVLG